MTAAKPVVTILYEDSRLGKRFPLHELVLRMLEDDVNGERWKLQRMIRENPKNGVDKLFVDLRRASLIAGSGFVYALIDLDKVITHLNRHHASRRTSLSPGAAVEEIKQAVLALADDPSKVRVFLLNKNVEDLIRDANACAPPRSLPDIDLALQKKLTARDSVLQELAKEAQHAVRKCIRVKQPDLDALITELAVVVPHEAAA